MASLPSELTTRMRAAGRRRAPASGPNCVRASARPRRSVHASIPDRQHPCALPRSVPTATFLHGLNRRSGQCSPPRCDAREFGGHSAVAAAATSAVRWVAVKRRAALAAAPGSPDRRSAVVEELDLTGVDELRERRMFGGLRGDLSSPSGPRCRVLPRGNGTLSGFWVLLAMRCIAASSFVAARYLLPFPGIDGVWR